MKVSKRLCAVLASVVLLLSLSSIILTGSAEGSDVAAAPSGDYIQLDVTAGSAADMRDPAFRLGFVGITAEEGDKLVYDVWVTQNVIGLGGLKITGMPEEAWRNTDDGSDIRNSVNAGKAVNAWYTRTWNLTPGVSMNDLFLTVFHEGDWSATAYYRNIRILDKNNNVKKVLFNSYYDRLDSQTGLYRFEGNCNDITAQVTMNVATNVAPGVSSYFYLPRQMSGNSGREGDKKCLLDKVEILENSTLLTCAVDADVPYKVNYTVPDSAKNGDKDAILLKPTYSQDNWGADGNNKSNFKLRLDITVNAPDASEGEYMELVINYKGDANDMGCYRLCDPNFPVPAAADTGYVLSYDVWIQDPIVNVGGMRLGGPSVTFNGEGYHEVGKPGEHGYLADLRDEAVGRWYTRTLVISAPQGGLINELGLAVFTSENPDMQYETRAYYRNIRILDVSDDLHGVSDKDWMATDGLNFYKTYSNRDWGQDSLMRPEVSGAAADLIFHMYSQVTLGEDYFDPELVPAASVNANQVIDGYNVIKGSALIDLKSTFKNGLVKLNYNAKQVGVANVLLQANYSSTNFVFPDEGLLAPRPSRYYIAMHINIVKKVTPPTTTTTTTTAADNTTKTETTTTTAVPNDNSSSPDIPNTGVPGAAVPALMVTLAAAAVTFIAYKKRA